MIFFIDLSQVTPWNIRKNVINEIIIFDFLTLLHEIKKVRTFLLTVLDYSAPWNKKTDFFSISRITSWNIKKILEIKKRKNINHFVSTKKFLTFFIGCPFPSTLFTMIVIHLMINIESRQFCIITDSSNRNIQGIHWTSYWYYKWSVTF